MSAARPRRRLAFRPQFAGESSLETRQFLTANAAPSALLSLAPDPAHVDFDRYAYLVSQSQSVATVTINRTLASGTLVVRFTTDSSPHAGKNFRPVDTMVTFADGESTKTVQIPLIAGASNPGQIQVGLRLTPQTTGWATTTSRADPEVTSPRLRRLGGPPSVLRISSKREVVPPQVIATDLQTNGVTLTFSEPMDPARASDRRNYVLKRMRTENDGWVSWVASPFGSHSSTKIERVSIKSANYDPATNSVTLVTARPLTNATAYSVSSGRIAPAARTAAHTAPSGALTDTSGNILVSPTQTSRTAAGSFRFILPKGKTSPPKTS